MSPHSLKNYCIKSVLTSTLKSLMHKLFWPCCCGALSDPYVKQIVCQHSHAVGKVQSTCLFQIQHAIIQTGELHPPGNEHPPYWLKWRKGRRLQGLVINSNNSGYLGCLTPTGPRCWHLFKCSCFQDSMHTAHAHMPECMHERMHACTHPNTLTHTHTHTHMYTHTHTHTHTHTRPHTHTHTLSSSGKGATTRECVCHWLSLDTASESAVSSDSQFV